MAGNTAADEAALLARISDSLPPYARAMGIEVLRMVDGAPLLALPFAENVHGRPGHFHGGALSGLLEMASFSALRVALGNSGRNARFKPININVEFLRGASDAMPTVALGDVTRAGRRVANVSVRAWQADREKPVAEAWLNFLLSDQ